MSAITASQLERAGRVAARLGPLAARAVRATELTDLHNPSHTVVVDCYDVALLVACVHALRERAACPPSAGTELPDPAACDHDVTCARCGTRWPPKESPTP